MHYASELPPIDPAHFFTPQSRERTSSALPSRELLGQEAPQVDARYNNQTLIIEFSVTETPKESLFPRFERGDAILFSLNVRPEIKAKKLHRYCYQFVILPCGDTPLYHLKKTAEEKANSIDVEGVRVHLEKKKRGYHARLEIPFQTAESAETVGISYVVFCSTGTIYSSWIPHEECSVQDLPEYWLEVKL